MPELLAGDDLTGSLQKQSQDAEGLFLNLETYALPRKNSLEKIDLIEAEPEGKSGIDTVLHEELSPLESVGGLYHAKCVQGRGQFIRWHNILNRMAL